jgi:hypothetical protein
MSDRRKTNSRGVTYRPKKKTHKTAILFWICLILVIAPFAVLGWILFSSSLDTNTPVIGNRYEGDLDPAITKDQMSQVESAVKGTAGVENSEVDMQTATLRIYADIADTATADDANMMADSLYSAVSNILNPDTYFTKTNDKKMYDLEIHVFTKPEREETEGENFVYVIDTKTSSMSEPKKQLVSEPLNAEVAQSLRDAVTARKAEEEAEAAASANPAAATADPNAATADPNATPAAEQ